MTQRATIPPAPDPAEPPAPDQADTPAFDSGSWRDPDSRVFVHDGQCFRVLSADAHRHWSAFLRTGTFSRASSRGAIIETTEVPPGQVPIPSGIWRAVLAHKTVPFVSYPYEWTFSMLREAALLQLDLLSDALSEGFILKDGTAFNVQWMGVTPTFIDLASFVTFEPGEPWAGYRQFCGQCLNPLLLQACRGVSFRPWLRGSLEGIDPTEMARLISWRDLFRPGVFKHVYLHATLQRQYEGTSLDVRASVKDTGFGAAVIGANVRSLRRAISALSPRRQASPWVNYARDHTYDAEDHARKRSFVEQVVGERPRDLVWDMGANTGEYARLAAVNSRHVIAFDADEAAVDALYQRLRIEGPSNILPLVVDAVSPSPGLGWRNVERKSLLARGRPDLVLCLALVHHLALGANVPFAELVSHLAETTDELVIEFVDRGDPMVTRLLRNRADVFPDYSRARFEAELGRLFHIRRSVPLNAPRVLYHAVRHSTTDRESRP